MVWSFACSRVVPGTLATTKGLTGFLFFEIRWEGILADARRVRQSRKRRGLRGAALAGGLSQRMFCGTAVLRQ